ncbi:MAG: 3,4-dihydroxy-2-butanone-4-phosphate synthase, partial [Candidatus Altiarchaeota archaeon]|nr:3,4-dihydroxy-2-butanone-4-phosphate synthase [Candidatus Altiarchaeota archaeon]
LISSGLKNREGHTELSTALLKIAGLTPVAVICEMLDGRTHKALSREDAMSYARRNNLGFLEVDEIKEAYRRWLK